MMNDRELKIYQTIMYTLTPIFDETVRRYKTDFTVYDIPLIINTIKSNSKLFWFIRKTGTHVLKYANDSIDLQDAIQWADYQSLLEYNERVFLIDGKTGEVRELTNE